MFKDTEGVIFDLDGTLVDSMWIWSKIDLDFINERNLSITPEELMGAVAHFSFLETAQYFKDRFNLPETKHEIAQIWLGMAVKEYGENVKLKKGVREFLELLKNKGIKMGVASSNSKDLVLTCLKANYIEEYFNVVVTTDEAGASSKSDPDVYLYAADKMGIKPEKSVVFEDVLHAMKGAKKAGMKVIGIRDIHSGAPETDILNVCELYLNDFTSFTEEYLSV